MGDLIHFPISPAHTSGAIENDCRTTAEVSFVGAFDGSQERVVNHQFARVQKKVAL